MLYSWGLRQLLLVVTVVAFILHPLAGVAALVHFDRFQSEAG